MGFVQKTDPIFVAKNLKYLIFNKNEAENLYIFNPPKWKNALDF